MSDHTPGPWKADIDAKVCDVLLPDGELIATAYPMSTAHGKDYTQAKANAHLIAAAPDLLEAAISLEIAETLHANCDECEGMDVPECCEKCFPLFDAARIARRIAIAKATGK